MNEPMLPVGYQKPKSSKKKYLIIALIAIVLVAFPVVLFTIIGGALVFGPKMTEEYGCAMSELNKNRKTVEMLGEPLEAGLFAFGNLSIKNQQRSVNFQTSVAGPKGTGTLSVNSFRNPIGSNFRMVLETDGKELVLHDDVYPCG